MNKRTNEPHTNMQYILVAILSRNSGLWTYVFCQSMPVIEFSDSDLEAISF